MKWRRKKRRRITLDFSVSLDRPQVHEQSLQEMLRKARQQQQHNIKAKQHNITRPKQ